MLNPKRSTTVYTWDYLRFSQLFMKRLLIAKTNCTIIYEGTWAMHNTCKLNFIIKKKNPKIYQSLILKLELSTSISSLISVAWSGSLCLPFNRLVITGLGEGWSGFWGLLGCLGAGLVFAEVRGLDGCFTGWACIAAATSSGDASQLCIQQRKLLQTYQNIKSWTVSTNLN